MSNGDPRDDAGSQPESGLLDDIRQAMLYPPEFRIPLPEEEESSPVGPAPAEPPPPETAPAVATRPAPETPASRALLADLATCLWYLKTKHFKRAWSETDTGDDDPRVRRALGRIQKSVDALARHGIEVHDPTNTRYPVGGESLMRPIQLLPTAGVTVEVVSETITPIIYSHGVPVQRGEVFVTVPETAGRQPSPAATRSPDHPDPANPS